MISGIAGIIAPDAEKTVKQMMRALDHRGSDAVVYPNGGESYIGCVALHLPNETGGGDPVVARGTRHAVVQGEVYNAEELWAELGDEGNAQRPAADLALRLYEQYGSDFPSRLNGSFAIVVVDSDRVLLARDPLGHSPLYYGYAGGSLCFASEMKALREATDDINIVPPGHRLTAEGDTKSFGTELSPGIVDTTAESAARRLREQLDRAVQRRVSGLDEIGVWLSGGIDSSAVAALAKQFCGKLQTFSCGAVGAPDLAAARTVAEHLGTEHHELLVDHDKALQALPEVIYHLENFDAPLVRSSVANYLTAQAAGEKVSVVLSGEGGDELFGGYSQFKTMDRSEQPQAFEDSQHALHDTAFQRVDRMACSARTRSRLTFSDPEVVALANSLPPEVKIRQRNGRLTEKWVLRQAVSDLLPDEITWRPKDKFWSGSGVGQLVADVAETQVSEGEFREAQELCAEKRLRSREELYFYRLFHERLPEPAAEQCIGRTAEVIGN